MATGAGLGTSHTPHTAGLKYRVYQFRVVYMFRRNVTIVISYNFKKFPPYFNTFNQGTLFHKNIKARWAVSAEFLVLKNI